MSNKNNYKNVLGLKSSVAAVAPLLTENFKSEDQLQAFCWQWAWNQYPEARRLLWAVPNGGDRDEITAAKLKATGVLSGVHDVHFFWKGKFTTFEFKYGNNDLTRDGLVKGRGGRMRRVYGQLEWGQKIQEHGGTWYKIKTFIEFKQIFESIIKGV